MRRFFHPDYTVGMGVSPIQPAHRRFADFTASEELHLALKQTDQIFYIIVLRARFVKAGNTCSLLPFGLIQDINSLLPPKERKEVSSQAATAR